MRITIYVDRKLALIAGNDECGDITREVQIASFTQTEREILSTTRHTKDLGYDISHGFIELEKLVENASLTSMKKVINKRRTLEIEKEEKRKASEAEDARKEDVRILLAKKEKELREAEEAQKADARILLADEFALLAEEIRNAKKSTLQERTVKEALEKKYHKVVRNRLTERYAQIEWDAIVYDDDDLREEDLSAGDRLFFRQLGLEVDSHEVWGSKSIAVDDKKVVNFEGLNGYFIVA